MPMYLIVTEEFHWADLTTHTYNYEVEVDDDKEVEQKASTLPGTVHEIYKIERKIY